MNRIFVVFGLLLMSGLWYPQEIPAGTLLELNLHVAFIIGLVMALIGLYDAATSDLKGKWEAYAKASRKGPCDQSARVQ